MYNCAKCVEVYLQAAEEVGTAHKHTLGWRSSKNFVVIKFDIWNGVLIKGSTLPAGAATLGKHSDTLTRTLNACVSVYVSHASVIPVILRRDCGVCVLVYVSSFAETPRHRPFNLNQSYSSRSL